MKTRNSNRVNMINTTIAICDANTATTAGIPSFATVLGSVKSKMVLINSLNQIADGTTTGVTLDTKALRKAMTDLALKCANATLAFANSIHNNTLAALVNYSESELNRLKKEDVDDTCEAIHDATNANIAGVTNFGVVASDVTDLQASIDLYRTASQNPRQALISKSQAKLQVTNMIREVIDDLMIAQMDKMVNTLKTVNKDFWSGYKQARQILDLGTTTAKVRGTVLDEEDVPLKGVIFSILDTGTEDVVVSAKTDNKGKFNAAKLAAGTFDFKWELSGYKTVVEPEVKITNGKELKRKVVMDAAVVQEGDLNAGQLANIDLNGIDGNGSKLTKVILEASGSTMRFYAAKNPNDGSSGVFIDVTNGQTITKTPVEFAAQVGFGNGNSFLNVQNVGGGNGHWKITFEK